jgi:hypothetical protein
MASVWDALPGFLLTENRYRITRTSPRTACGGARRSTIIAKQVQSRKFYRDLPFEEIEMSRIEERRFALKAGRQAQFVVRVERNREISDYGR